MVPHITTSLLSQIAARLAFGSALLPLGVLASEVFHQEISVEAPFDMPVIRVPVFPDRDFVVTDYGAAEGDGRDISQGIHEAIAACHEAGGGRVVIPRGRWSTGKVHLQSNVNLHVAEGAVLFFSGDPEDYLPAVQSSWEGMECYNYSPLIYAFGCTNIAISGKGRLEARMGTWEEWFSRPPAHMEALRQLYHLAATNAPVEQRQMAVDENRLRPQFIQFNRCRNVLVEDVQIRNSPFWTIHLLLCDQAVVRRVAISALGHNNDGIDPEMTRNLLVEHCRFDQGDDAIAIKAGRNQDAWRLNTPTENVVIRHCTMVRGHQLVAIGSELSGGIRNVYVHDCRILSDDNDTPQNILYIKTNRRRGGFVENIHVQGITANSLQSGVLGIETDVLYQWRDLVPTYEERITVIRGIHIRNVTVGQIATPFRILGDTRRPVEDVFLEDIRIQRIRGRMNRYENANNVHETDVRLVGVTADEDDEE